MEPADQLTPEKLFGRTPLDYGVVSLIAARLAWVCWPLVLVVGVILVLVVEFLLAMIAVVSGLLGFGAGVYYQKWAAFGIAVFSIVAVLGLSVIGFGAWFLADSMAHLGRLAWEILH